MNVSLVLKVLLRRPIVKLILGVVVVFGVYFLSRVFLAEYLMTEDFGVGNEEVLLEIVSTLICITSFTLFFRLYKVNMLERFSFKNFGSYSVQGFILGGIIQLAVFAIIYFTGNLEILYYNGLHTIVAGIIIAFFSAIFEEILLRGVVFTIIEDWLGSYWAIVISAILFGFGHLLNPNATLINAIEIALQTGLLLALLYIYARNLWLPIVAHFAWNFVNSLVFGAKDSGSEVVHSLFTTEMGDNELITGGAFGTENTIHATLLSLIVSAFVLYRCIKENKIRKLAYLG